MKTFLVILFLAVLTAAQKPEKDWWETANFYQIYPRSFKDSNNDGIGDLKGIISKLPYLKEIGVTATWLSPILKSPQVDFGYDVADFFNVDEIFGTNEDLAEMFAEAKKLGIKIIMDFVPNHTSDQHQWFIDSVNRVGEYTDYYVWHDGQPNPVQGEQPLPPNNWQAVFKTIAWTWNEQRQQYYLHQFDKGQPDLNYRNPRVVEKMKEVLVHWMDMGADGFRIDAINHLMEVEDFRNEPLTGWTDDPTDYGYTHHWYTKDLDETYEKVQEFRELIDKYNEEHPGTTRVLFTEAYANLTFTMKYFIDENGKVGSHFPFNFILIENLNENSNAFDFKYQIDSWLNNLPSIGTSNWVLGNHDKPRVGSRYGEDRIDGMLMLLLLLPGVAVTYNGDEIGMVDFRYGISWEDTRDPQACNKGYTENYMWDSRDPVRTPFQWDNSSNAGFCESCNPWLPVNTNYEELNLEQQRQAEKSFFKFYQQLSTLRTTDDFKYGHFFSKAYDNDVFAFKRSFDGHSHIVLINFGNSTHTVNVNEMNTGEASYPEKMEVVVAGSRSSYNARERFDIREFVLKPFDAVVLTTPEIETTTSATTSTTVTSTSTITSTSSPTTESTTPASASSIYFSFGFISLSILIKLFM